MEGALRCPVLWTDCVSRIVYCLAIQMTDNIFIGMDVTLIKSLIKEKVKLLGNVYKLGSEGWSLTNLELGRLMEALDRKKLLDMVEDDN